MTPLRATRVEHSERECPRCEGKGGDCRKCNGHGVLEVTTTYYRDEANVTFHKGDWRNER